MTAVDGVMRGDLIEIHSKPSELDRWPVIDSLEAVARSVFLSQPLVDGCMQTELSMEIMQRDEAAVMSAAAAAERAMAAAETARLELEAEVHLREHLRPPVALRVAVDVVGRHEAPHVLQRAARLVLPRKMRIQLR